MGIFGFGKKEVIYFPGCYSSALLGREVENYKKILKKLGVDFSVIKDMGCCGGFLEEAGYEKQLRKNSKEKYEEFESHGVKKIITSCPLCLSIFSKRYKDILPNWSVESESIIVTILNKLKEDLDKIRYYTKEEIAYYDSCYYGRYNSLHEAPREILKLIGYKLIELPYNKEETICCGSCGGLPETNKELAEKIMITFIRMLRRRNITSITTADPRAYNFIKNSLEKLEIRDIKIREFSELICNALNVTAS